MAREGGRGSSWSSGRLDEGGYSSPVMYSLDPAAVLNLFFNKELMDLLCVGRFYLFLSLCKFRGVQRVYLCYMNDKCLSDARILDNWKISCLFYSALL